MEVEDFAGDNIIFGFRKGEGRRVEIEGIKFIRDYEESYLYNVFSLFFILEWKYYEVIRDFVMGYIEEIFRSICIIWSYSVIILFKIKRFVLVSGNEGKVLKSWW